MMQGNPGASTDGGFAAVNEPVDQVKLDELLDLGGEDFVKEVVDTFLKDGRLRIEAIKAAFAQKDVARSTREAHALKSSAASVGAEALRARAAAMELAGRTGAPVPPDAAADLAVEFDRVAAWFAAHAS
jgi:HPt (histidine-containing phosphotransfer) domain-containing protein